MFDESKIKLKPLSTNAFAAFFQKIYRHWLGCWYTFCERHEKLSAFIYKFFFFIVFSVGVTVWQYIVMTFLPYAFDGLSDGAWGVPNIPINSAGGNAYIILGDERGLGYFIAFEIAVFTAQCINFPLQRSITFKSHGNPYFQAMWYFIGWVLISLFTSALWGIVNCYLLYWGAPAAVLSLVQTLLTGLVSFVIFFFIFMLIFPDRNKQAKSAERKHRKLLNKNAEQVKISKAHEKLERLSYLAEKENARKAFMAAESIANSKALAFSMANKELLKMQEKEADESKLCPQREVVERRYLAAVSAADKCDGLKEKYDGYLKS